MATVEILEANYSHVLELAKNLRAGDREEILAAGHKVMKQAIEESVSASDQAWTLLFDGKVAAIFGSGIIPAANNMTAVWGLTSTVVDSHRLTFMRTTKKLVRDMARGVGRMVALVDVRYLGAVHWLECLGFTVRSTISHPVSGLPFHVVALGSG